ncbi:hypothetical protein LOC71_11160 [Rhodopirellula sp. JC740]|uniref:Uncharacterized protein n=1 Tax=Rhodopirellula halodulae TaxID=2894198 RepID=A0ABS8NH20_9BACT|nr:hypothetical protein [Rhodopirellula sp. JC740]MCC9642835.1 hypothetical protein [Rhodopirellula sp. JC740]
MSRVLLFLLALFALAGVLAPRSAEASCGDWLQHPTSPSEPSISASAAGGHVANADDDAASEAFSSQGHSQPNRPVPPCSGPLCSKLPSLPLPAPMPPLPVRSHQEAAWLELRPAEILRSFALRDTEAPLTLREGFQQGIDRPPQSPKPFGLEPLLG